MTPILFQRNRILICLTILSYWINFRYANAFYAWLTESRAQMMEGSGTLEEQLAAIGIKAHEVVGRGNDLKKIEDLGAILEEKLILDNRSASFAVNLS